MFGILPESSHYLTSEWFLLSLVLLGEGKKKKPESAKLIPDSASSPTPTLSQIFLGCLALATVAQSKHEPVGLKQMILHSSVEAMQRAPRLPLRAGPLVHCHTITRAGAGVEMAKHPTALSGESSGVNVHLVPIFLGQTPYPSSLWRKYTPFAFGANPIHQPLSLHVAKMAPGDLSVVLLFLPVTIVCPAHSIFWHQSPPTTQLGPLFNLLYVDGLFPWFLSVLLPVS